MADAPPPKDPPTPPAPEAIAANVVPEKLTLLQIIKALTLPQVAALAGSIVAIVVGCVTLGGWVQSARDDDKIANKDKIIQASALREAQLSANIDGAKRALKQIQTTDRAIRGKSEFLERYLSYVLDKGDVSKKLFVDHVCALWKQSQEYSIHIDKVPLNLSDAELRRGLTSEVRKFLADNGVSASLLDQSSGPEPQVQRVPVVIPSDGTHDTAAHFRVVMEVSLAGAAKRLVQAVQHASTMSS